jgi:(p)ppGpp synthase/HD superfamily hydrolase
MMPLVKKARDFAIEAHGKQKYGDHPYIVHPEAVAGLLEYFGFGDEDLMAAAYLHDTLEDTKTTFGDLVRHFGTEVASLVYLVTDKPGKNRAERHALTYTDTAKYSDAVALKLCDRIANVEASLDGGNLNPSNRLYEMYKNEHKQFTAYLYTNDPNHEVMWHYLHDLLDSGEM